MAVQFILNLFIALLWILFKDEDAFRLPTFVTGFIIGLGIVFLMRRFFGGRFYIHRLLSVIKLVGIFISETFQSAVVVIKQILSPRIKIKPGIFKYETCLRWNWEVLTPAFPVSITTRTGGKEVTPAGHVFSNHPNDNEKNKADLIRSLKKFEKAIMEVTR